MGASMDDFAVSTPFHDAIRSPRHELILGRGLCSLSSREVPLPRRGESGGLRAAQPPSNPHLSPPGGARYGPAGGAGGVLLDESRKFIARFWTFLRLNI